MYLSVLIEFTNMFLDLTWAAFWGFLYPKAFFDMFTPYSNFREWD